jgi:FtsH-binding integral membrane protein
VKPTTWQLLAAIFVCCGAVAWLAVRASFNSLPPLPFTAVPALLVLAIAETALGRNLRARMDGRTGRRPLAPTGVAQAAVLARASSAAAALFGGLAAGMLVYVSSSLDKAVPKHDAIAAGVTLGAAVLLCAAALYLERCCRAPRPPDEHEDVQGDSQRQR